ncbi:MAG: 1,4-alpha-glucan branching enzyme, partial [Gammaproteobacteria bacterium]|nr:1,4-alpha-glucan branching enzyme [Gammaproteobacteria bacterium]
MACVHGGSSGVFELFIPNLPAGTLYKFEIRNRQHETILLKTDPYGQRFELRPGTASITVEPDHYDWQDHRWTEARAKRDWLSEPMSIYEVHLGSWRQPPEGGFLNYRTLAEALIAYIKPLGFTHLELLPI